MGRAKRFRIDYEDHHGGGEMPGSDAVEFYDLARAERESLKSPCQEAGDVGGHHAAASITVRNERGDPLSIVSVHVAVKRL